MVVQSRMDRGERMTRSLHELLLSVATGELEGFRVHKRRDVLTGEPVEVLRRSGHHPGLWEELQTTIARLSRMSGSAGTSARPAESAMPYHRKASEVAHRLGNTVTTWARLFAEEHEHLEFTATTVPAAARWLATFPTLLAEHPAAGEMYSGILQVVMAAGRVIDRAPDKVYAGPCYEPLSEDGGRCEGQLYATQGKPFVHCRECGARHEVEARQEWLSQALGDQLVTAAEAAPVLSWLSGKAISRNLIAAWKRDGRVEVHAGRWPYRFGDLVQLAREVKPRASKLRSKEGSAA